MPLMYGPFVGDWRTGDRAERGRRMSAAQMEWLHALAALESLVLRLDLPLTRVEDAGLEPWLEQPNIVRAHLRRLVQGTVGS
jgi:hypothetical protein